MKDIHSNADTDKPSAEKTISDQQICTRKLELENKTLRAVLDSMPDNISIKDLEGRYIFDNSSHCRFLGAKDTSEVVGKTLFDFFPIEMAAKFHAEDLQVLRSGKPIVRCVDEAVDSGGKRVWMSVTKMPLYDEQGQLLGLVSATRDVTARRIAEEQLAKLARELQEKNTQLEDDLETARELQSALLPQQYPTFPSSASHEASALRFRHFFRPSSSVGGDFFHIFQISNSVAGVFISDVMGHGVRGALVAAILRTLVEDSRAYAVQPAEFLQELNRGIAGILKHAYLPIFASACYVMIDIARGELRYANAGHPTPLWIHRGRATAEPLPASSKRNPVLGIFQEAEYHSCGCELLAGDTVLLFTDGLFEVDDAEGKQYGQDQLLRSARELAALRGEELDAHLVDEIQQFAGPKGFTDDVCLVAIELDHLIED